jgi:CheY-like chemotaxis protein
VVLVVEDQFLIAMDLQHLLEQHGWRVLGPALAVEEALRLLDGETPDVALLDVNLRGATVIPVAEALRARGACRSCWRAPTTAHSSRPKAWLGCSTSASPPTSSGCSLSWRKPCGLDGSRRP